MSWIIYTLCTLMVTLPTMVMSGKGIVLDCYNTTASVYDGNQGTTVSGKLCLKWEMFNQYTATKVPGYPNASISDAVNFCRAPDGYPTPWCFVSKSEEWEICGINKCDDDVLTRCGQLSIETPTVRGRNVTFSFTPDTHDPNAYLYWQRKSGANEWSTLRLNFKFSQYQTNNTYHLVITDCAKPDDEQIYRVDYYNATMRCRMETKEIELKGESCGLVQLKSENFIRNGIVEIEYYPPNNVLENPDNFERHWIYSFNQNIAKLQITNGRFEEELQQSDKYVLKIFMFNESMNGEYGVYCGNALRYTDFVTLEMKELPSLPIILGLQDLQTCTDCIVGNVGENFNVSCEINNGTRPLNVTMTIGNESHILNPYNSTSTTYIRFFRLREYHHLKTAAFSVMNAVLLTPLQTSAQLFVIKPPLFDSFLVPETLREGEDVNITCTVDGGRPIPIVYFNISGSNLSSEFLHKSTSSNKQIVSLTTFKREWSRKHITCCRYNEWYRPKLECSQPKQVNYLYPPAITFNISGSALNITKGKQAHVECLAESVPISNISWIEELSNGNEVKKQCNMASNCIFSIDANGISKRRFICSTHYLTRNDRKHLTVNILEKSDKEYGEKQKTIKQVFNKLVIWIILGSCLLVAGIIITVVLFVVIKKRRLKSKEKKESRVSYNVNVDEIRNPRHNSEDDLRRNQNEVAHAHEIANEVPEYSLPLKKKTRENIDTTYSHVNKTRISEQPRHAEDGQLLYADLDFDPNEVSSKGAAVKQRDSPTEYVDIDYVKTKAEKDTANTIEEPDNIYANE